MNPHTPGHPFPTAGHNYNSMFKIKNIDGHMVDNSNMNYNTRLQDGPVFTTTHPNGEPLKRRVMYAGAFKWNYLPGS